MNRYTKPYPYFLRLRLLISLVLLHTPAFADSVDYMRYTVKDGFLSNNVYNCMQDHLGYMWFATDGGAVQFNGYNLYTYNTASGLPFNDIFLLSEDKQGRVFTFNMTNRFGYIKNGEYTELGGVEGFPFRVFTNDCVYFDGLFCIALSWSDGENELMIGDSLIRLRFQPRLSDDIASMWLAHGGYLFYTRKSRPDIFCTDLRKPFSPATRYRSEAAALFDKYFGTSDKRLPLGKNVYGFVRGGKLLGKLDYAANKVVLRHISEWGAAPNEYNYVTYYTPQGTIFLVTNAAVYVLDADLKLRSREPLPLSVTGGSQVSFRFKDRDGDTWYMTDARGIWHQLACPAIMHKQNYPELLNTSRFVSSEAGAYSYWWNNEKHILFRLAADGAITDFKFEGVGRLEGVCRWSNSTLLLAFQEKAFFLAPHTSERTDAGQLLRNRYYLSAEFYHWATLLKSNKAIHLYKGKKLFSLSRDFVIAYEMNGDSLVYKNIGVKECSQLIFSKALDRYIAYGLRKVVAIDPETYKTCTADLDKAGLFSTVKNVCTDSFANIYVQTTDALYSFTPGTGRLQNISVPFNLNNATVSANDDLLAIAGSFGIAAAKVLGAGKIGDIYMAPNMRSRLYYKMSDIWIGDKHTLFARTDKEWITVNTDSLFDHGLNVQHSKVGRFSLISDAYDRQLHDGDTLRIPSRENTVKLSLINLYGNGIERYQYITDDSKEWQFSNSGVFTLNDPEPGQYTTLKVKVSDADWQSGAVTLHLYSVPRWWQRRSWIIVFWISSIVLLVLLILLTIYITSAVVRRSNEKKRMQTDLELRAIHSQINPHFIFNTLSTALYFISRKEYDNAYGHVNKFSHLLRSYLKSSHDRYVLLSEEVDMLKRYVELQQTRFEEKFDFELNVDNKIPVNNIQIPSLLLQPLVENAINHGLFHKKEKGLLKLGIEQGETRDSIIITIDDNGVGRAESTRIRQESMTDRESYGSRLTQKLMDIFRRYEAMDIQIAYIDKELPATGTIVRLTIGNVRYIV